MYNKIKGELSQKRDIHALRVYELSKNNMNGGLMRDLEEVDINGRYSCQRQAVVKND